MKNWIVESRKTTISLQPKFGVLVDMREYQPINPDTQIFMKEGQKLFKSAGMQKSSVILANLSFLSQFKRITKETGISEWERYIDASKTENWEEVGENWLNNNIDPLEKDEILQCADALDTLIENTSLEGIDLKENESVFSQIGTGEFEFPYSFIIEDK
jgi:hypothetical protein